jgi:hypothetical protein
VPGTDAFRGKKPGDLPGGASRRQLVRALDYVREHPGEIDAEGVGPPLVRDIFYSMFSREKAVSLNRFCEIIDGKLHFTGLHSNGNYISMDGKFSLEGKSAKRARRKEQQERKRQAAAKFQAGRRARGWF